MKQQLQAYADFVDTDDREIRSWQESRGGSGATQPAVPATVHDSPPWGALSGQSHTQMPRFWQPRRDVSQFMERRVIGP